MSVEPQADHSDSTWRWTWIDERGEHEVLFVHARSRWLKGFRPADPGVTDVPWTPTQQLQWRRPESEYDAAQLVHEYANQPR